jgi:hypothetical protein
MRRFPAPWTVEPIAGGFKVIDANRQAVAYVYGHDDPRDAATAKGLTLDEARRIAANIAKLPKLLHSKTKTGKMLRVGQRGLGNADAP